MQCYDATSIAFWIQWMCRLTFCFCFCFFFQDLIINWSWSANMQRVPNHAHSYKVTKMTNTRMSMIKSQSLTDVVLTEDNQMQLKANQIHLDAPHVFAHMIMITQIQYYHTGDNNQEPPDGSQCFDCNRFIPLVVTPRGWLCQPLNWLWPPRYSYCLFGVKKWKIFRFHCLLLLIGQARRYG